MCSYKQLKKELPPRISKEKFYKVCHISKATALHLFEVGLVPVIDTGKINNRYYVAKEDVLFYLKDREADPEKYCMAHTCWVQTYDAGFTWSNTQVRKIHKHCSNLWKDEPDLLTVIDLNRLIGYSLDAIRSWLRKGEMQSFRVRNKNYITKVSLLDFVASEKYQKIIRKSKLHVAMLKEVSK